ncbi:MAG TPA: hypothetical protein VK557_10155 [Pyrinomonadaceae bacterium]|nr:hypothetical protein [Pyrinomonadaceae bacterium]
MAHSKEALGVIDVSCSPSGCEDYAEDMAVEVEMSCDCGEDDPQPDGYVYVWTYESCEEEEIEPTINEAWANSGQDSIAATAISYFDRHTIAMAVSTFNCTWGEGYESSDEYGCDYWYW